MSGKQKRRFLKKSFVLYIYKTTSFDLCDRHEKTYKSSSIHRVEIAHRNFIVQEKI